MISLVEEIKQMFRELSSDALYVGLCTTSGYDGPPYYSYPKKCKIADGIYFHIVFSTTFDAIKFLENFNLEVKKYFIDVELKNINFHADKLIEKMPINTQEIRPNFLTITDILRRIKSTEKNILLHGHGSLANMTHNVLVNEGKHIDWLPTRWSESVKYKKMVSRCGEPGVNLHNYDLMINFGKSNFAEHYFSSCSRQLDIVVSDIKIASNNLIELLDVSYTIRNFIDSAVDPNLCDYAPQKVCKNGVNLISGGFRGNVGDFIVDNAADPRFLLGQVTEFGFQRMNRSLIRKDADFLDVLE